MVHVSEEHSGSQFCQSQGRFFGDSSPEFGHFRHRNTKSFDERQTAH